MKFSGTLQDAKALVSSGQLQATIEQWEKTLEPAILLPRLLSLGGVLSGLGLHTEAIALHRRVLALDPHNVAALCSAGESHAACQRWQEALECFLQATQHAPVSSAAWSGLGYVLLSVEKFDGALNCLRRAASLEPENHSITNRLGLCLLAQGKSGEAIEYFQKAVAQSPDFVPAWNNLAVAWRNTNEIALATRACETALKIQPQDAANWTNLGVLFQEQNQIQAALKAYRKALEIDKTFRLAHLNEGIALLLNGDLLLGWIKYEYRWLVLEPRDLRHKTRPFWRGTESLCGKTILLHSDQGFGDTIQLLRYTALLARMGTVVHVEVNPVLVDLAAQAEGVTSAVSLKEATPEFDFHCPFLSLPLACRTTLESIPQGIPYLKPSAKAVEKWSGFSLRSGKPRVALVWRGNPNHDNDRNRSIALEILQPLLDCELFELINLQRDVTEDEARILGRHPGFLDATPRVLNFDDTAAVLAQVDLVISVDTAVAHLAGALGRPVWVLLPFAPDWRWMLERSDSPWYPTARLFRQPVRGDWMSLVPHIAAALANFCKALESGQ